MLSVIPSVTAEAPAPLRVAHDDVLAAQLRQHGRRDLAGEGALLGPEAVLRAQGDRRAAQRLRHRRQRGERRAQRHLHAAHPGHLRRERRRRTRWPRATVLCIFQLPAISGVRIDVLPTAVVGATLRGLHVTGCIPSTPRSEPAVRCVPPRLTRRPAPPRRAAPCLPGTPATRRRRSRCGSSGRRSPSARPPPPSRRRRRWWSPWTRAIASATARVPVGEGRHLEDAHRARSRPRSWRLAIDLGERLARLRPDVHAHPVRRGWRPPRRPCAARPSLELGRDDHVGRQLQAHACSAPPWPGARAHSSMLLVVQQRACRSPCPGP